MRTRSSTRSGWPLPVIALLGAMALVHGGCGSTTGTTGYSDPVTTTSAGAVIDAVTLTRWIDEGRLNAPFGSADRVVVVSTTTPALFVSKQHIPESLVLDAPAGVTAVREEGLGPVIQMMLAGSQMDGIVQRLGIDERTTIVLTFPRGSTDLEHWQQTVAYWTFRYWGFSRDRVKLLNGGDDAWEAAGQPLTDAVVSVPPSTFSVARNGALKDHLRYSVGEVLSLVDQVNRDPAQRNAWQIIDVRGATVSPYLSNAVRLTGAMQFMTDRVGNNPSKNRLYPDRETLLTRLRTWAVKDGVTDAFVSPDKKTLVMCRTSTSASTMFTMFDAVLAVPEGDIGMYDGSSIQWYDYGFAKIKAAGATDGQAVTWAFDAATPGTQKPRSVGVLPLPNESPLNPTTFMYLPTQPDGNQVESADQAYMSSSGGGTPGPSDPGGAPGSGC